MWDAQRRVHGMWYQVQMKDAQCRVQVAGHTVHGVGCTGQDVCVRGYSKGLYFDQMYALCFYFPKEQQKVHLKVCSLPNFSPLVQGMKVWELLKTGETFQKTKSNAVKERTHPKARVQ